MERGKDKRPPRKIEKQHSLVSVPMLTYDSGHSGGTLSDLNLCQNP